MDDNPPKPRSVDHTSTSNGHT